MVGGGVLAHTIAPSHRDELGVITTRPRKPRGVEISAEAAAIITRVTSDTTELQARESVSIIGG